MVYGQDFNNRHVQWSSYFDAFLLLDAKVAFLAYQTVDIDEQDDEIAWHVVERLFILLELLAEQGIEAAENARILLVKHVGREHLGKGRELVELLAFGPFGIAYLAKGDDDLQDIGRLDERLLIRP